MNLLIRLNRPGTFVPPTNQVKLMHDPEENCDNLNRLAGSLGAHAAS